MKQFRYSLSRVVFCLIFLSMIFLRIGIGGSVNAHEDGIHLRFAHLSPTAPAVDIYIHDRLVTRSLEYKSVSAYFNLDGYTAHVIVVPAGAAPENIVTDSKLTFPKTEGRYFTVAVIAQPEGAVHPFELIAMPADSEAVGSATEGGIVVRDAFARATALSEEHSASDSHEDDKMQTTEEAAGVETQGEMQNEMSMDMNAVSGAYMFIENNGDTAETLVSAQTDVADMVQIHQTTVTDGLAKMREVEGGLEIPANGSLSLKPGGYHMMIMGLKRPLVAGDVIEITLTFESGKAITVAVPVMAPQ